MVPTIRENQQKSFSSWKSGNFNIFCQESGKVWEIDLTQVDQIFSLISKRIIDQTQWLQIQNFSLLHSEFCVIPVRSVQCREVRESQRKCPWNVREFKSNWLLATLNITLPSTTTVICLVWMSLISWHGRCGSPPGVMMADTLTFTAKIGVVDFWV